MKETYDGSHNDEQAENITATSSESNQIAAIGVVVSWIVIIVAVVFLLLNRCLSVTNTDDSTEEIVCMLTGEKLPVKVTIWERVSIDGIPSVQAKFNNPEFGFLEMSYNSSMGFRFGLLDKSGAPKVLKRVSFISYPIICTQEMVDQGQLPETLGKELMYILPKTSMDSNSIFIYCNDVKAVEQFSEYLNDGSVTWLQLSQFFENGKEPSAYDSGGKYIHYIWGTRFISGEFSKAIERL